MATQRMQERSSSGSESAGLVVSHALSASSSREHNTLIVDSGATCHMCHDAQNLKDPLEVVMGDGCTLTAAGKGYVTLGVTLPNGKTKTRKLHDVVFVPKLSYNLLSVSKAAQRGNITKFTKAGCYILDKEHNLIAKASKVGSLYYLDHKPYQVEANSAKSLETKDIWHRHFGHLGVHNLQRLARDKLVDGFDYDASKDITFCKPCVEGKQHQSKFPLRRRRAEGLLDLVRSDECRIMNAQSQSGGEYFLTFIDDKTHYVWVYIKDQVFKQFLKWK